MKEESRSGRTAGDAQAGELKKTASAPDSVPEISPDMTVLDVIHRYRETEAVFKGYDDAEAGVCICCSALFETLEDVSAAYGIDRDELLEALRRAACR